ncbi:hypothetical protein N0V83_000420 [Neocucurbitaria cava]|uniref:Uncharacterized protein n=1 Tax=Neocucurbitaria cava TaxID=798079 RepID=A0A9W8YIP0_9PLEO|nr:hypothetical protein N0V83_000420 [Neocucurbitaria cava]
MVSKLRKFLDEFEVRQKTSAISSNSGPPSEQQESASLTQITPDITMLSFMVLPRELRDKICTYVLFSQTNECPDLNQTFEQLLANRTCYDKPRLKSWLDLTMSHPGDTLSNATNLLLVNHQLHAETLENIKRYGKSITYDLDIILLDEILLLPTWTHVPILTTHLEEVNVTFRISGKYDAAKELPGRKRKDDDPAPGPYAHFGRWKGFRIGCGAGYAMGWQIYSILERFIRAGPTGNGTAADEHRHIAVKTLNINVETLADIDPARFGPHLINFLEGNIGSLLYGTNHEWFEYGQILYEHVDEVVVLKDGEELRRFDVAAMLESVVSIDKYLTQERLDSYKESTWMARRKRDLKAQPK